MAKSNNKAHKVISGTTNTKNPLGLTRIIAIGLTSASIASCGFQIYQPKSIEPLKVAASYQAHDPNSEAFHEYLLALDYPESQLPIQQWGLRELTYSALFFHPQLDVARAQWRAARSAEVTAAQRPLPGISTNVENHSQNDGGVSPWTYGLSIDVPVETGGKRQARIDRATSLTEAARIDIAQRAWEVRSRLTYSLIDYNFSAQQILILQAELDLRTAIVGMLEKRLEAGMSSSIETSNARLQLQKTQQALEAEKGRLPELRAALANNAGLSVSSFEKLPLPTPSLQDFSTSTTVMPAALNDELQQATLLNRLDIRAALARYAAAEAKLRLEIAKQYPDITLSPGYSYDQGDKVWSLGISALMTLINKNRGLIAEANALRDVEAAQFQALQASVIGNLAQASARYFAVMSELDKARQFQQAQQARIQQTQKQFDAGFADRLELTTTRLENLLAQQNILNVAYKAKRATANLEDIMQQPIEDALSMPAQLDKAVSP